MKYWTAAYTFLTSDRARLLWAGGAALLLAFLAGWLAYSLSTAYYATAPYHFDSAHYRVRAYEVYESVQTQGRLAVAWETLRSKDSLDVTLRVLFAPDSLLLVHGHLLVLLAFMALFLTLLIYYIVKQSGSWLIGISVALLVFSFPFLYHPYKGIADYWIDPIATWILAAAILCWLLSENLRHMRWGIACSLLLVCVLAERTVIAVYAAPLFLMPLILIAVRRVRQVGVLAAARTIALFALPAVLLGGAITVLRWQELYGYYFVWGYDYGTRAETAQRILTQITNDSGISLFAIIGVAVLSVMGVWRSVQSRSALVTVMWFVVALPVEIVLVGQFYHSFFVLWAPMLLVLLAVLLRSTPHSAEEASSALLSKSGIRLVFGTALVLVAFGAALLTQQSVTAQAHSMATHLAPLGRTYRAVARAMADAPSNTTVAVLFDLVSSPLNNHVMFDYGRAPVPVVQVYTHDQYYVGEYGRSVTADKVVRALSNRLASGGFALSFAFADSESVNRLPYWGGGVDPISRQVITELTDFMRHSPHWRATGRIASPYGDIVVYTYAPQTGNTQP